MDNYIYTYYIYNNLFDIRINVYEDDSCELNFENEWALLNREKKCFSLSFVCSKFNVVLSKIESTGYLINKFKIEDFIEENMSNEKFSYEIDKVISDAKKNVRLLSIFSEENMKSIYSEEELWKN